MCIIILFYNDHNIIIIITINNNYDYVCLWLGCVVGVFGYVRWFVGERERGSERLREYVPVWLERGTS